MKPGSLRGVVADALSVVAAALGITSRLADQGASLLRGDRSDGGAAAPAPPADETPPGPAGPVDAERLGEDLEEEADDEHDRTGGPPPVAPQAAFPEDAPAHVREPDTHAAEIAGQSADEVVARVGALSTDELRALYEHESSHDRRQSVLSAIEQALTP